MSWDGMQGWAALIGIGIVVIGMIFSSGKIFQDHVNTKDRIKSLEDQVKDLKSNETAIELVKQAVEALKEEFSELRHDLRNFLSIELGKRKDKE